MAPKRRPREPMTEEEAALYQEMLNMKADEARRAKEELVKSIAMEKKEAEERYSKTNALKIQNHWRSILRQAKVASLHEEVQVLAQSHEREVDRKDSIIAMLMKDLEDSEAQYQMAARSHLRNINHFIFLQEERVRLLERDFQESLAVLLADFNAERETLMRQHKIEVTELRDIIAAMDDDFTDHTNKVEQEHTSIKDELRRRQEDDLVTVSNDLRAKVLKLYSMFRQQMDTYNLRTSDKQIKFRNLKAADTENAILSEQYAETIRYLQQQRDLIRAKMTTNDREFKERNRALCVEKDAVSAHFHKLKERMGRFREEESKRLTALTVHSHDAITKLEERLQLAERILSLAEINRKLETEEEKVLPYYETALGPEDLATAEKEVALIRQSVESSNEWDYLENFYKRYNKVLLDRMALDAEHEELTRDNAHLKDLLKRYLEGISVNNDVLADAHNPLFRSSAAATGGGGALRIGAADSANKGTVPTQEAAHIVMTQRVHA